MKVSFDLKSLRVVSMDNAMINIGKNWIITSKGRGRKEQKGGERRRVERLGRLASDGDAPRDARTGEPRPPETT
jgi:hypothetical protein